ncbi:MAG: hypothetical protein OEW77_06460 [Gemmatimonadota bacterium]|nr:hypothetical protein [Gemmatimonadota bacterium]
MTPRLPLLVAFCLTVAGFSAQALGQAPGTVGTLVVAHGGDSTWNAAVLSTAGAAQTGGPVEVSFLMGPAASTTRFQDAVARLERAGSSAIVVVPLLVSSHSGHYEQVRWLSGHSSELGAEMRHHLAMSGIDRPTTRLPVCLSPALDDAPELAHVLRDRALRLADSLGTRPDGRALLIVGHGPNSAEDNAEWMANLRPVADSVRVWTGFRDVRVDLVRDDAPPAVRAEAVRHVRELLVLQRAMTDTDVLVVPLLVARGAVSRDKLPRDLAGTPHVYGGATLLPHPAIVRWIERGVGSARCGVQP